MKKLLFILAISAFTLTSCTKKDGFIRCQVTQTTTPYGVVPSPYITYKDFHNAPWSEILKFQKENTWGPVQTGVVTITSKTDCWYETGKSPVQAN